MDLEPERRADLRQPFEVAEYLAEAVVGAAQLSVAEEVEVMVSANMPRSVARSPLAYASYPRRSRSTFGWSAMPPPLDDSVGVEHSPRPGSGAMVVSPGRALMPRDPQRCRCGRWAGTGSNRRPCGFQLGVTSPGPSALIRLIAFALVSKGLGGLIVQSDTGSCGSVQISWAERRQNQTIGSLGLGIEPC